MEIVELAKEIFQGHEVRVYGTPDTPKFLANDVAKILDIKNVRTSINKFEEYKKCDVRIMDTTGRIQTMTALTEPGLYALVLKSKKQIAKEFEKWILTEVLPSIRKTGKYNIQDTIDRQRLEALENENKELKRRTIELSGTYKPIVTYHQFDINEFTDEPCVYLISLSETDFKFGVSGEIDCRSNSHFNKFRKLGLNPKIIKLWKCKTMKIMKDTEFKIKLFAKHNDILVTKYDQKEIIITDDIGPIVENITKCVDEQNSHETSVIELKKMELEIRKLELENESKRLDIELRNQNLLVKPVQTIDAITDNTFTDYDNVYHSDEDVPDFNIDTEIVPTTPVPPIKEDKTSKTKEWIKTNPPQHRELTTAYYRKYTDIFTTDKLPNNIFGKLVRESGYKVVQNTLGRQWSK